MTQFLPCVSFRGSPFLAECTGDSQEEDVSLLCKGRGDGLARSAARSPGSDCHLGLLWESLSRPLIFNLRLCACSGCERPCSVLFNVAFKIPSQKSVLGKDMLRELCSPEVTIWPIFISLPETPRISVGTDAGPIIAHK